jgi:hypothetical protein
MGSLVDRIKDLTNLLNNNKSIYKINLTDNSKKIEKSKKIKKCNFNGCKEIMDLVNRHTCIKCGITHCMFHRVYEAHECKIFINEQKSKENTLKKQNEKIREQNKLLAELKKEFIS